MVRITMEAHKTNLYYRTKLNLGCLNQYFQDKETIHSPFLKLPSNASYQNATNYQYSKKNNQKPLTIPKTQHVQ